MRFLVMILWLAACLPQSGQVPMHHYRLQTQQYLESFDYNQDWQEYDKQGFHFRVTEGAFRAELALTNYAWTQNKRYHENVMLEVELWRRSPVDSVAYGVMCRASPQNDGKGYYFMMNPKGSAAILRGNAYSVESLTGWVSTDAIDRNYPRQRLRAVCINDYLALYINGQFVVDTVDRLYAGGYAGLVTVSKDTLLDVVFDNLEVWDAVLR